MNVLLIYNSTNADSIAGMGEAYTKYNTSDNTITVKDTNGLALGALNTWIGTLGAAAYDKIFSFVNSTRIEEALATAVITLTAGAANEIGYIQVANAGGDILLSVGYTSDAGTDTADADIVKATINDGTAFHGFSADNTLGVVTITAPAGSGVTGDTYVATGDADTGGTLAIVITTDFSATSTGISAVGASGDFSEAYFIDLEAKITAVPEEAATAQAGGASTVTLVATASAVDDYYNGMFIFILTNTGAEQVRMITDYNGTTKVATVDYAWGTNPDATSTYSISSELCSYGRTMSSKSGSLNAWEKFWPTLSNPKVIQFLGTATYPKNGGIATSAAAGTLVDTNHNDFDYSAVFGTADAYVGFYVGIVSGTGAGQVREVKSHNTNTLTLETSWTVIPDTTSVYMLNEFQEDAFLDSYIEKYILTYANDFAEVTASTFIETTETWERLVDLGQYSGGNNGNISKNSDLANGSPYQDLDFLYNTVMAKGKAIYKNSIL